MPFRAWRNELRMQTAKQELLGGERIADVAAAVGYRSPEAFMRAFKLHVGVTPSEFAAGDPLRSAEPATTWPLRSGERPARSVEMLQELFITAVKQAEQGDHVSRLSLRTAVGLAAMTLFVTACGDGDDEPSASTVDPPTSESDVESEPEAAPETEPPPVDEAAGSAYPRDIEHAFGTTTLDARPRVAMIDLARSLAGDLLALGVETDLLVAEGWGTDDATPTEYFDAAERLGLDVANVPAYINISAEEILDLAPDLVLIYDYRAELEIVSLLDGQIPVIGLPFDDRDEYLRVLIETFGLEETAPAAFEAATAAFEAVDVPSDLEVSIFSTYDAGGPEAEVYNLGSPTGQLLRDLGVDVKEQEPSADDPGFSYLVEENWGLLDADVVVNMTYYGPPEIVEDSAVFQSLPAVGGGRFVQLDPQESYILNFPSLLTAPRVAEVVERIVDAAP